MRSLLILTLLLLLAAPARAGTYEHHTLSAASPGLDGWSPHVAAPGGFVAKTVANAPRPLAPAPAATEPASAGAPLAIAERVPGGRWTSVTGVRTRPDGRFTAFTRIGPSRRLRITAPDGARGPLLTVRVRAPLTVRAVRRGAGAIVRGRVRGGHIPRGGAAVELQTRSGPRWVTRLVVRTSRSGRFAGRLEWVPPGRLVLRARVPRQPGLPFAAGLARAGQPSA